MSTIFENLPPRKPQPQTPSYYLSWHPEKRYVRDGVTYEMRVNVELREYFSITMLEWEIDGDNNYSYDITNGGCCHELIGEHFPELKPFFDLHLRNRFGESLSYEEGKTVDLYLPIKKILELRAIYRESRIRWYLHAREFINFIRSRSLSNPT